MLVNHSGNKEEMAGCIAAVDIGDSNSSTVKKAFSEKYGQRYKVAEKNVWTMYRDDWVLPCEGNEKDIKGKTYYGQA